MSSELSQERYEYPKLQNLMACYLNQDYDTLGETPEEVIAVYKYENQPLASRSLAKDMLSFMDRYGGTETELEAAFKRVFRPEMAIYGWNGRTLREELDALIAILQDPNDPGHPEP